ncbi:MAG: hypothetical protein WCT49_02465 [Candidatus Paceibacterota bacterium]|nr:hypothetical protein [Candidatus Paceibacterota bacterium]
MKKIIIRILFIFFISFGAFAAGHEVEPIYKKNDLEVNVWGYTNIVGGSEQDFMASQFRIRTGLKYKEHWLAFVETDIAGLDSRVHANYITQGWVGYNFGKEGLVGKMFSDTTIRGGLLMTAGEMYLPASYATIPAGKGYSPFKHYASGIQVQTMITPRLLFIGDVTGSTGLPYNDKDRWSSGKIETSQRLQWDAIKNTAGDKTILQLALMNAWSDEFHKIGVTAKWSPTKNFDWYNGAFRSSTHLPGHRPYTETGWFTLPDYKLWSMKDNKLDLRVHAVYEERTGGPISGRSETAGIALVLPKDGGYGRFKDSSVTLDFTHSDTRADGGPNVSDNAIMTRVRIFF